MTETIDRTQTIRGLRELADFLETHTGVPISGHRLNEFAETREEWDAVNASAPWLEVKTDDFLVLRRTFAGGVVLEVNVERPRADDDTIANTHSIP